MKTYTAVYERDGDAWLVEIAEEPRCHSWGRNLAAAQTHIRDALALWLDQPADSFELVDDVRLPGHLQQVLTGAQVSKDALERLQRSVREMTAQVARALTESGLSMRDTAWVMGLSHQRVDQLLDVARATHEPVLDLMELFRQSVEAAQEDQQQRRAGSA